MVSSNCQTPSCLIQYKGKKCCEHRESKSIIKPIIDHNLPEHKLLSAFSQMERFSKTPPVHIERPEDVVNFTAGRLPQSIQRGKY